MGNIIPIHYYLVVLHVEITPVEARARKKSRRFVMKAIVFEEFGSELVLKEAEVAAPKAAKGEVLIRIAHTSINPVDWKIREGFLKGMFPHVFPIIPGWDAAGVIEAVGEGVTSFGPGDEVYAYTRLPEVRWGTYAEFIALPESSVAKKPKSITSTIAAGVPLVGLTAFQSINKIAKVRAGERVLITGGSGGVGSYAIQFAKVAGAIVVATAGSNNQGYLKELGATHAVDYTKGTLVEAARAVAPEGFDVVFDTIGGETLALASTLLKPGGRVVSISETPKNGTFHFVYPSGAELSEIAKLIDEGKVRPAETTVRSVREAAAAQVESRSRHVRGKVVLAINF